jgi:hypothetical protein
MRSITAIRLVFDRIRPKLWATIPSPEADRYPACSAVWFQQMDQ